MQICNSTLKSFQSKLGLGTKLEPAGGRTSRIGLGLASKHLCAQGQQGLYATQPRKEQPRRRVPCGCGCGWVVPSLVRQDVGGLVHYTPAGGHGHGQASRAEHGTSARHVQRQRQAGRQVAVEHTVRQTQCVRACSGVSSLLRPRRPARCASALCLRSAPLHTPQVFPQLQLRPPRPKKNALPFTLRHRGCLLLTASGFGTD